MPRKKTVQRARKAAREGKAPTTQAGEFVHEEIEHVREGKHGARSAKQVIAIGLSKARRAGVKLPPPKPGQAGESTRKQAQRDRCRKDREEDFGQTLARRYRGAQKGEQVNGIAPRALQAGQTGGVKAAGREILRRAACATPL